MGSCSTTHRVSFLRYTFALLAVLFFLSPSLCFSDTYDDLSKALVEGQKKKIASLLSKGVDVNVLNEHERTPLMLVAEYGHAEIAALLISKGANVNARDAHGNTALILASRYGNPEIVDLLLRHKADIGAKDKWGNTSLMQAFPHLDIVKLLLTKGADINFKNSKGNTVLIEMASNLYKYDSATKKSNALECLNLVIGQGADLEARNQQGSTALLAAYTVVPALDLLISKGANIDAQDYYGQTALILASKGNYVHSAELLLSKGAAIDKTDITGKTALWHAKHCPIHCTNVEEILKAQGATTEGVDPYKEKFKCGDPIPEARYPLPDGNKEVALFLSPSLEVLLKENGWCRPVLVTNNFVYNVNIEFRKTNESPYPDIVFTAKSGTGRLKSVYAWDSGKYELKGLKESVTLNKKALTLFDKGKIREAIAIWEEAYGLAIRPQGDLTVNAEVINNLGFAYYKLAEKSHSEEYFLKAESFYKQALQVEPKRWIALLNLGEVYSALGKIDSAISSYEECLRLTPNSESTMKLRDRIDALQETRKKTPPFAVFEMRINSKLPIYSFALFGSTEANIVEHIVISEKKSKKIIQDLNVAADYEGMEPPLNERYFQLEDINFDGYKDIRIMLFWGATGNEIYSYWLFDPAQNKFIYNEDFKELTSPTLYPKTKRFKTHWNGGSAGYEFSDNTYEVRNGKPVLVRSVSSHSEKGYLHHTEQRLINGEMKTVKEGKELHPLR